MNTSRKAGVSVAARSNKEFYKNEIAREREGEAGHRQMVSMSGGAPISIIFLA